MDHKSFVVVGGSSGIGLKLVKRLTDRGDHVTVLSRNGEGLAGLEHVNHVTVDVLTDDVSSDLVPEIVDGLVYCPGSINLGPLRRLKPETLIEDFRLNVVGGVKVLQPTLPAMRNAGQAAMIMFSTVAVSQGMAMHASVAAAKGAVEGLTRSLAAELAPTIRVNCIAPSLTDTPLAQSLLSSDQKRSAMADRHPLKRVGNADEIAALAEFLLSENAGWITGQVIGADGGLSSLRM